MRLIAVAVVLALALAGCSSNDDAGPDPTPEPPGGPGPDPTPGPAAPPQEPITELAMLSDFSFTDCTGVRHLWTGNEAAVNALLPEGYSATSFNGAAQVMVEISQCNQFDAAGSSFAEVWFGRVYTFIQPPEAFPDVEADEYQYIFTMLAGEDILGALWPAAGFQVHNGTASLEEGPAPGSWRAQVNEYIIQASTAPPAMGLADHSFAWFHDAPNDNTLVWTGNVSKPSVMAGFGILEFPADSVSAELALSASGDPALVEQADGAAYEGMYLVLKLAQPL